MLSLEVDRITSGLFIPHKQHVVRKLQVGNKDPLYVFLYPEFDVVMEHFYFPQFVAA